MTTAIIHFNHADNDNLTSWPDMRISKWKPNYGDMLVCASIIRQLDLGKTVRTSFGNQLKQLVDRAIIRGSTYLHGSLDFDAANLTLDSIDAPTAIVGLGAQHPTADPKFLDDNQGAHDFIARLNEKSKSISVRGSFTASVVERLGGKNIRLTGCPSLFYMGSCPTVEIPEMLRHPQRRVGVSLHSGLTKNMYCRSPDRARLLHGRSIAWALENASNVSLFEQGVMREFNVADRMLPFGERLEAAKGIISLLQADGAVDPHDLIARMVSVASIEEWLAKARDLDAIIGFRFHGNMVAMLQGSPCYYFTYDSRIAEFCQLYGLPYQDVDAEWQDPVIAILGHDWGVTNTLISKCFAEMRAFYSENGFAWRT